MPAESKSLSEFPRALEVLSGALLLISNPSGQDSFDTNSALLTEVAQAMLDVHYTQELGDVSVFDAIKNTRVLSGTTTPTANEGANGQLYVKYETVSNVDNVVGMYFKKDGAWLEISLGGGNTDYIECTQAQYDAWEQAGTLDPDVMYFITDGQSGGSSTLAGLSDVNLTSPTDGQLLRYNGTSGKWENAGIINDTTASTSSVYSSKKTNDLLSAKQNATDNSLTTNNKQIVPAINELNYLSDIKRIRVEATKQSCAANSCIVVNYSGTVPTGYKVIGGYDNSYFANLIGVPIQLTDAGNFSFNYFSTAAFSDRTLSAYIIMSKNVNR